jgi:L-threonylcarbamoyladenylate synthase
MLREAKIFFWQSNDNFKKVCGLLLKENLLVSSTDTVLGLLTLASSEGFVLLNTIKKTRGKKAYIVLISQYSQLYGLIGEIPNHKKIFSIISQCWPGPLTVVFSSSKKLPEHISSDGTVAVRMPDHVFLRKMIDKTGPLFSTSANKSSQKIPRDICQIDAEILLSSAGIIIDDCQVRYEYGGKPSTIIDCSKDDCVVVRKGAGDKKVMELL